MSLQTLQNKSMPDLTVQAYVKIRIAISVLNESPKLTDSKVRYDHNQDGHVHRLF